MTGAWEVEPGIQLHYFTRGTGTPVLVLHGGPGMPSDEPWPGLEPLNDRFKFYYYHQRGCGRSTRPITAFPSGNFPANVALLQKALGIPAQVADIERIRKAIGAEKLVIVGHSFGGFLAALYAAEFPGRVEKLVLIAPADLLRFPPSNGGLYEQVKKLLPESRQAAYREWQRSFFDFGTIFKKTEDDLVALNLGFVPFWVEAEQAMKPERGTSPAMDTSLVGGWVQQGAFFSMGRRYDFRAQMKKVVVPTLVLVGDRDPVGASSVDDYRCLPNARVVTIQGSGHFPQGDAGEFSSLAGAFLGK
jgi:proline iminopeptidase